MGTVAELFRTWPGAQRSQHPVCSFAALGPRAAWVLDPHVPDDPFGESSPLARLYQADAQVLLLGAPWTSCTAMHLAERRAAPDAEPMVNWSPILTDGRRRVTSWLEYPHDTAPFAAVGRWLEDRASADLGRVRRCGGTLDADGDDDRRRYGAS